MPFRSEELNANLTKGAGNVKDITQLLREWHPGEDVHGFLRRLIDENILGRATRSRAADVVQNVLGRRYFPQGGEQPATRLATLIRAGVPGDVLSGLLYYHAALAEHLLYRVVTELIFDAREKGIEWISVHDVRCYVSRLSSARGSGQRYSDAVVIKLSGAVLTALRDFKILAGTQRKRVAPVHVPHQVVAYVAYALREEDASAKRILEHPDWRLFLLSPVEADEAILNADRHGHFRYQSAGDVRRFDWTHDSLDAYVDALTGSTAARD